MYQLFGVEVIEVDEEGNKYVTKVKEDGSTENITVETGLADANYVQIRSGLKLGDIVQYVNNATGNRTISTTTTSNIQGGMSVDSTTMDLMRLVDGTNSGSVGSRNQKGMVK